MAMTYGIACCPIAWRALWVLYRFPAHATPHTAMGRATKAATPANIATPLDPDPLLTPDAAAQFLGVSTRTLANWRTREMGPPFVRYSQRCIMYRKVDLQRWAQGIVNTPTGTDDPRRLHKARTAEDTP